MTGTRRTPYRLGRLAAGIAALCAATAWGQGEPAGAGPAGVRLELAERWGNVFAESDVTYHVRVTSDRARELNLYWSFGVGGRTLRRVSHRVSLPAGGTREFELRFRTPTVKQGVIAKCSLEAGAWSAEGEVNRSAVPPQDIPGVRCDTENPGVLAYLQRAIHVFPASPFTGRQNWLEPLDIQLFDPEKQTRTVFTKAGIPFEAFANVDAIETQKDGLLIVGAGVSFRDYRALGRLLSEAAARGRRILVLAPGGGAFPLPAPARLVLRGEDVIRELDKRLDHIAWPRDGHVRAAAVRLVGERGPVSVEVTDGKGWPWIEMEYEGGGRLVVCGFALVSKWDSTPTPRFLLARVLEHVLRNSE